MGSLAKPGRELVIDLINSDNGTSFAYNELVLSPPQVNDITNNNRNTVVTVTSSDAFQFSGSEDMYYNRLDFGILFQGLTVTLGGQGATDISALLPEMNATFGMDLTMDDWQAQSFPANPTWPLNLTILASPNSYGYIGQLNVVVENTPPQLGDNLANTVLGNIGSDAYTLETAVIDINTLSDSIIRMNLERYKLYNFVRGLAADLVSVAQSDTKQSLDISSLFDTVRSLRADLEAYESSNNTALGSQNQTLQSAMSALTSQVATLNTRVTSNNSLVASLQQSFTSLANQVAANGTAITTINNTLSLQQSQLTANSSTLSNHTSQIGTLQTQMAGVAIPVLGSVLLTSPSTSQWTGVANIAKLAILLSMETDVPCRVRLYPNTTERDADLSRASTTPAPAGIGQLFEGITTPTLLSFYTGPTPFLYNGNTPPDDTIAFTIEPTTPGVANVTLKYYSLLQ